MQSTENYRLFGTDAVSSVGNGILRTSDDSNFYFTNFTGYLNGNWWSSSKNDLTGNIYFSVLTGTDNSTFGIFYSSDEGDSWYSLYGKDDANDYKGITMISNFDELGYAYFTEQISSTINTYRFKDDISTNKYNYGLVGEWSFNENSGTTAYDSSGNGNNGTILGATWQNDGVLNTLTSGVDYTVDLVTGLLTLDTDYLYEYLFVDYDYNKVFGFHVSILNVIAGFLMIVVLGVGIIYVVKYFKNIKEYE
jgi:hypothetical protein